MQTDIWLTEEISHPDQCPLCSEPLRNGSTTCFSCGFSMQPHAGSSVWIDPAIYGYPHSSSRRQPPQTIHQTGPRDPRLLSQPKRQPNPITPIPPRASAQPANAVHGSIVIPNQGSSKQKKAASDRGWQRKEKNSGAFSAPGEIPTLVDAQKNSPVWEYESPDFQAASSLPVLSLLISESPTQPEIESRGKATRRLPRVDEIDTVPPLIEASPIDSSRALVPTPSRFEVAAFGRSGEATLDVLASKGKNLSSWTAGEAFQSSYARLISSRSRRKKHRSAISLNPIDRVRWWLLRPGRIEFILWLGGTVLLVSVTCVLLLVTAFSFEWLTPGFSIGGASSTNMAGSSTGPQQQATITASGGLILTRTDTGPLLPGQPIHVHGQGFSHRGHIEFLFDGTQPILDQYGKTDSTQADAQGVFSTTLRLNENLPWHPGPHFITARDLATNHVAKLAFILAPGPIGKGGSGTPVPSYPPGITPTPVPGGQPTAVPVGSTPGPVTPTANPGTPTATPTVGTTPGVTPTVGTTPTVGITPGVTPTAGQSVSGGSSMGNAIDHIGDFSLRSQLTNLNPWVWVMVVCYSLSMVLLGLAGVLRKHRR